MGCRCAAPFAPSPFRHSWWSPRPFRLTRLGVFPTHAPLLKIGCRLNQACARIGVTEPAVGAGLVQYFSQAAISCRRFLNRSPRR